MSRYYRNTTANTEDTDAYRLQRREWHSSLYATDFDLVEYVYDDTGTPRSVAYTEYKYANGDPVDEEHGQLTVIATDAFRLRKPAFFVRWLRLSKQNPAPLAYFVHPLNLYAYERYVDRGGEEMSEYAYFDFLMNLHGDTVSEPEIELSTNVPESIDVWPLDKPPFID